MRCCGPLQEIELRPAAGGRPALAMVRCTGCARRDWQLDGVAVSRQLAFGELSDSYRSEPRVTRAARDRSASRSAARVAAHAAAVAVEASPAPAVPQRAELAALLAGWSVLGAA